MLEPVPNAKNVFYVNLEEDLAEVVSNLGLGLLPDEMEKVKEYFEDENRKPTDVELQAIDQAWSEHCCYKSSKPVLEETVFGLKSSKKVIAREDAGIMEFDDKHYYAVGLESHNHPSALDPYGGSATENNYSSAGNFTVGKGYQMAANVPLNGTGAVIEFVPGKEALLHVSEIAWERVEKVTDYLNIGDKIEVKYLGTDPRTRKPKISRKVLLKKSD